MDPQLLFILIVGPIPLIMGTVALYLAHRDARRRSERPH